MICLLYRLTWYGVNASDGVFVAKTILHKLSLQYIEPRYQRFKALGGDLYTPAA
jgi:hypothetical protein